MSINVEHVNPFITATIDTFKSMIKAEIKPGKLAIYRSGETRPDVSGIIGLGGDARGTVALCFPRITALKVVSAFGGMRVVTLDKDCADAVGELANIVAGAAKKHLLKYKIAISLPSVVMGESHEVTGPSDIIPVMVPFTCDLGPFQLVISFKSEA